MNALLSNMGFSASSNSPSGFLPYSACSTPTNAASSINPITMAYPVLPLTDNNGEVTSMMQNGGMDTHTNSSHINSLNPSLLHPQLYQQQLMLLHQQEMNGGGGGVGSSDVHGANGDSQQGGQQRGGGGGGHPSPMSHFFPLTSPTHHSSSISSAAVHSLSSPSDGSTLSNSEAFQFPSHLNSERWRGSGVMSLGSSTSSFPSSSLSSSLPSTTSHLRFLHPYNNPAISPASSSLAVASLTHSSTSSPSSSSPLRPLHTPLRHSHSSSSSHLNLPTPSSFLTSSPHFSFSPLSPSHHSSSPTANSPASLLSPVRDGGHLFSPSRFYVSPPKSTRQLRKRTRDFLAPVQPLQLHTEEDDEHDNDTASQPHPITHNKAATAGRGKDKTATGGSTSQKGRAAQSGKGKKVKIDANNAAAIKKEKARADQAAQSSTDQATSSAANASSRATPLDSTPLRPIHKSDGLFSPLDGFSSSPAVHSHGVDVSSSSTSSSSASSSLFSPLQTPQRHSGGHKHFFTDTPHNLSSLFSPAPNASPFTSLLHSSSYPSHPLPVHLSFPSPSPFTSLTPATPERRRNPRSIGSPIQLLLPSPLPPLTGRVQQHTANHTNDSSATTSGQSQSDPCSSPMRSRSHSPLPSPSRFFCASSPSPLTPRGQPRPTSSPVQPRVLARSMSSIQPSTLPRHSEELSSSPASAPSSPNFVSSALFSPHKPFTSSSSSSSSAAPSSAFTFQSNSSDADDVMAPHCSRSETPLAAPRPSAHGPLQPATPITPSLSSSASNQSTSSSSSSSLSSARTANVRSVRGGWEDVNKSSAD